MLASFQGLIGRVEVPDLLTFVHLGRRTGVSELARNGQATRVFFQKGDPVFATSDKEGLRLGDLLMRMGRITKKDRDRCIGRQRVGGPQLGQILVSEGVLREDELSAFLKVQVSEVIFDTFGWTQGTFAFYDDVVPPPDAVTLQMDIQTLLMEGVRRMDERGRLAEVFPDLDAVVEVLGNRDHLRENVTLTPEEWRIVFLIDGHRSLREICQLSGNPDELASLEVLNRLLNANLIGFASPRALPAPSEEDEEGTLALWLNEPTAPAPKGALPVQAGPAPGARGPSDAPMVITSQAVQYTAQTVALWARLVLEGAAQTLTFPLTRESHTLGRSPKNDIVIADALVSTFHARIDRTNDGFNLVDLKSTNGTFVNGKRVTSATLKPRDEIQVGPFKLRYADD